MKNNNYWDTRGITHNRELLSNNLNNRKTNLLWSGMQTTGTYSLNDDFTKYDFLIVTTGGVGGGTITSTVIMPWQGVWRPDGSKYDFNFYAGGGYISGYFSNKTTVIIETNRPNLGVRSIYGVKV